MSHCYCRGCHGADAAEFDRIAKAKVPPYTTCDLCGRQTATLARSSLPGSGKSDDIVNFEVGPVSHGHVVDDAIVWFQGEANRETCAFCAAQPVRKPSYAVVTGVDREDGGITCDIVNNESALVAGNKEN